MTTSASIHMTCDQASREMLSDLRNLRGRTENAEKNIYSCTPNNERSELPTLDMLVTYHTIKWMIHERERSLY